MSSRQEGYVRAWRDKDKNGLEIEIYVALSYGCSLKPWMKSPSESMGHEKKRESRK